MDTNGHTILSEDYVSFETAKLLKEKGFNGQCRAAYTNYGQLFTTQIQQYVTNVLCSKGTLWECTAPTLQMAMKWLRKKYISIVIDDEIPLLYKYIIKKYSENKEYSINKDYRICVYKEESMPFVKYEQAVEAALKYSLENLLTFKIKEES